MAREVFICPCCKQLKAKRGKASICFTCQKK